MASLPTFIDVHRCSLDFKATQGDKEAYSVEVFCGSAHPSQDARGVDKSYIETTTSRAMIVDMLQDHALGRDMLLIGGKGTGKTALIRHFSSLLGYEVETLAMHKELSSRELLQRRTTLEDGSTVWEPSPLIKAALNGSIAVLDNIDRLPVGSLSVLQPLITRGEIALCDGTRLVPLERYQELMSEFEGEARERIQSTFRPIHPAFRVIVVATTDASLLSSTTSLSSSSDNKKRRGKGGSSPASVVPSSSDASLAFLNQELRESLPVHILAPYSITDLDSVVRGMLSGVTKPNTNTEANHKTEGSETISSLLALQHALRENPGLKLDLSTRQLIRIMRRAHHHPEQAWDAVNQALLSRFMPSSNVTSLHRLMVKCGMERDTSATTATEDLKPNYAAVSLLKRVFGAKEEESTSADDIIDNVTQTTTTTTTSTSSGSSNSSNSSNSSGSSNSSSSSSSNSSGSSNSSSSGSSNSSTSNSTTSNSTGSDKKNKNNNAHLVPNVDFTDIPNHRKVLAEMSRDFELGEHLLLIGNQGVGKNKITDRFLQTMSRSRQYIQLHRDTTVQSLTVQPSLVDGRIVSEPSPLVIAVREGHVLLVDEADKAPLEVVCILKGLIDGEMTLADGTRLLRRDVAASIGNTRLSISDAACESETSPPQVIYFHPDFRLIVLANRAGWPFLGNDFYRECGDLFSVHAIDNPDPASELALLQSQSPSVSEATLRSLSLAFGDLRDLVEKGLLSYPYSTREAINVSKHLEKYPNDSLTQALQNVFSFDVHDHAVKGHIQAAFERHGLKVEKDFWERMGGSGSYGNLKGKGKGDGGEGDIGINYTKNGKEAKGPKHGKVDPKNEPHVGGNQWAGGTGGRDTAGLGGKGGPYRLSSGHPIHQLSDEEKSNVSDEVKKAANQMAKEGLRKKLNEIDMGEKESNIYQGYFNEVKTQVQQLRVILKAMESKSTERVWMRNQTHGDLCETKLVEGLTGESNIYKRRGESEVSFSHGTQPKRKRIRFVMDVSGSMYYFNGHDGRLERLLETAILIMESFVGFETKVEYAMSGHSGDDPFIPFVDYDKAPENRKERMKILHRMVAHTQYTLSGDNTLRGTKLAIEDVAKEDADEHFVFVISDANFRRYGIRPETFSEILTSDAKVKAYAIFIASLSDQANTLLSGLPQGQGHVCLDTSDLPTTFNNILKSNVLR